MNDEKIRVFAYSPIDEKLFVYKFKPVQLEEAVTVFQDDIWFTLTDEEIKDYLGSEEAIDNLKNDFVWANIKVNGRSVMQCTCGNFLESAESTERGFEYLAKKALKHHQRTGHTLNPRGN